LLDSEAWQMEDRLVGIAAGKGPTFTVLSDQPDTMKPTCSNANRLLRSVFRGRWFPAPTNRA
jgi:hypothetical protein